MTTVDERIIRALRQRLDEAEETICQLKAEIKVLKNAKPSFEIPHYMKLSLSQQRMVELLKQDQYVPMPVEKQVVVLYAGANGFIDDVPVESVRKFEAEILAFMDRRHPELLKTIREKKIIDDTLKPQLEAAIKEFKGTFKT